ncbi:MAG: hypothetical protein WCD70_12235 [Alphaproteobacteria bacterium]
MNFASFESAPVGSSSDVHIGDLCRVRPLSVQGVYLGTAAWMGEGCGEVRVTNNSGFCGRGSVLVVRMRDLYPAETQSNAA